MRRATMAALMVGLLAGSGIPALADDSATDEDAGVQRIDVPDAGLAISFPASWSADIEMREREDWGLYDEGLAEAPVPFWNVVYASDGGRPWCDLTWYPTYPLSLADHATRYEALMEPDTDVVRTIEVTSVALPAGEAYRFTIFNEPTDDHTTVYLISAGETHYLLQCVADERAGDDWLAVAETLTLTGSESSEVEAE